MTRRGLVLLLLLAISAGAAAAAPARPLRVLFIGNSLTSANDLPGRVADLARAAGDEPRIEVKVVAFDGFSLADHLAEGSAMRAIEGGRWDVVVLQQGPSTLRDSREELVRSARTFAAKIRARSGRPALLGVWPEESRRAAFTAGIASYRAAADAVDGLSFPAALAWQEAWRSDPAFPLYGTDRFHPSPLGTHLAALVVCGRLRGRVPDTNPEGITPEQARLARKAAASALEAR